MKSHMLPHLSFADIGKIIRMINGLQVEAVDLKDKSIETRAIFLFSIGKTPLAIELKHARHMQEEF